MKLRMLFILLAIILAVPFSAFAQYQSTNSSPVGLALSFYRPSGAELKSLESNWIGAELFYHAKFDEQERPRLTASIGWYSTTNNSTGTSGRFVPIRVDALKRFGEGESCWYAGYGLDCYFASYRRFGLSDDGTLFGFSLTGGREFGNGWFAEIRRDQVSKLDHSRWGDIDFSGWSINVGSRFAY